MFLSGNMVDGRWRRATAVGSINLAVMSRNHQFSALRSQRIHFYHFFNCPSRIMQIIFHPKRGVSVVHTALTLKTPLQSCISIQASSLCVRFTPVLLNFSVTTS
jgi:hypothetical protein